MKLRSEGTIDAGIVLVDQVLLTFLLHRGWASAQLEMRFFALFNPWVTWLLGFGLLMIVVQRFLKGERYQIARVLLVSGLLSNGIALLRFGHIIDYLPFGPYTTNPADCLIVGGIVLALVLRVRRER